MSHVVTGEGKRALAVWAAVAGLCSVLLPGCYKELTIEETDTVGTFYDTGADFAGLRTYYLPDSLVHLGIGTGLTHAYDEEVLDRVAANFENDGYRRVTDLDAEDPDALVLVYAVRSTEWYAFSPFSWWSEYLWSSGLEDARAGRYEITYGWRPDGLWIYDAGTLFVVMLDVRAAEETGTLGALWLAGISGLLAGSPSEVEDRLVRNIDQAFVQSPYLRVSP